MNVLTEDRADGPHLSATWTWAQDLCTEPEISELAGRWTGALQALTAHAARPGSGGLTPSDLLIPLSQPEIDELEADQCVTDIWPLAPLQEGLLFHAQLEVDGPDVYTVQVLLDLDGQVDPALLRRSAECLLRRHPNLRAGFSSGGSRAVQVIPARAELPWAELDLSLAGEGERAAEFQRWLDADRLARFDPARPPLLRFTLARLGQDRHRLVLTNHHLLLDGWSLPILVGDLLKLYQAGGDETALQAGGTVPRLPRLGERPGRRRGAGRLGAGARRAGRADAARATRPVQARPDS